MKAKIIINRHKAKHNKKHKQDLPCISIRTYKHIEYTKQIQFGNWILKQDFNNPLHNKQSVWIEHIKSKKYFYVDSNIVKKNRKENTELPCIIQYKYYFFKFLLKTKYFYKIKLGKYTLKQNFKNPLCNGASVWLEGPYEDLIFNEEEKA